jgi:hypothetical protein
VELRSRSRAAGVIPNGEYHSDRVGESGQIRARALCLEGETVVAERDNLNLQAHAVDSSLKGKSSVGILCERTGRNRYREAANLEGHVFGDRVNPIAVLTQGEGFVQIEARRRPCADFELRGGRGERNSGVATATATETGANPAGKGELVAGVSAPLTWSIVNPETILGAELKFAT